MSHWAAQYIGRPWVNGAQGPDEFDCWGLVRYVQKEHFGRDLPMITVPQEEDLSAERTRQRWLLKIGRVFKNHPEREFWPYVLVPQEGDGATMACNKHPWHVGVWIEVDGGKVLHCIEKVGVVASDLVNLRSAGWGRIEFFRRVG